MALALAGVMTLGMSSIALAEDSPAITKTVKMPTNGGTVDEKTFTFTATQIDNPKVGDQETAIEAPKKDVAVAPVTIKSTELTKEGGYSFDFSGCDVPGQYTFEVREQYPEGITDGKELDENGYGWIYSDKVYYVQVIASKKDGDTACTLNYQITEQPGDTTAANKKDDFAFENQYFKKGNTDGNESFKVAKEIGANAEYANPDDPFEIEITFTKPDLSNEVLDEKFATYKGTLDGETIDFTPGTAKKVTIKAGQAHELVFANIPAGASYTISETKPGTNYTLKQINVTENGQETEKKSEGNITDGENSAKVINDFKTITPTGLAISVAPFVAMFAAVGAAIALYVAAKRRVR
jgi:hypothetical protein